MRKCQKFSLKLVVKLALLAAILQNQLGFFCQWLSIFREKEAQCVTAHVIRFPQNTTTYITTVAKDYVICLECRSLRICFAFSLYFS